MRHDHDDDNRDDHTPQATGDFRYDISRRTLLRRGLQGGMALGATAAAVPFALGPADEAGAQTAPPPPGAEGRPPRDGRDRPGDGAARGGRPRGGVQAATFLGEHQAGIVTPPPTRLRLVTFDLATSDRADVVALFQRWTEAANRLTEGGTTLTFGVGPSFFERLGLQARQPSALAALPAFAGDAILEGYRDGDMVLQLCATTDATTSAVAAEVEALAEGVATVRATQVGFREDVPPRETPRNLMGFKDGTANPPFVDGLTTDQLIWAGSEAPAWLQGGSYLVMRRIRIDLAAWEQTAVAAQEAVIGRDKETGAPLTGTRERDRADFGERDSAGNLVIAADAHIRRARPQQNGGARILRRGYGYRDSEADAGLIFLSYQRNPAQFTRIQSSLSASDALNRFTITVGSGVWAVLPGVATGGWLGQALLEG